MVFTMYLYLLFDIEEWYNDGRYSKDFVDKIAGDLNLSIGGLMQYKMTGFFVFWPYVN